MSSRYISSIFVSEDNIFRRDVSINQTLHDVVVDTRHRLRDHLNLNDSDLEQNLDAVKIIPSNPEVTKGQVRLDALVQDVCPGLHDTLQIIYPAPMVNAAVPASVSPMLTLNSDPRLQNLRSEVRLAEERLVARPDEALRKDADEAEERREVRDRKFEERFRKVEDRIDCDAAELERLRKFEDQSCKAAERLRKAEEDVSKEFSKLEESLQELRKHVSEEFSKLKESSQELRKAQEHVSEEFSKLKESLQKHKEELNKIKSVIEIRSKSDPTVAQAIELQKLLSQAEVKVARALNPDIPEGKDHEAPLWLRSAITGQSIQERKQSLRKLLEEGDDVGFSILLESDDALSILAEHLSGRNLGEIAAHDIDEFGDMELELPARDFQDLHRYVLSSP